MNRAAFFKSLRRRNSGVFGTSLSQKQVEGIEAILDECRAVGCDLGQTAYILATAFGETGGKMQPRRENMNYSAKRIPQVFSAKRRRGVPVSRLAGNPQLLANTVYAGILGNRVGSTDGWDFRGAGLGQITGRSNFEKWGRNLGIPLTSHPELLEKLDVSVKALVRPMMEGWATDHKLSDYVSGSARNYVGARRVWNGTFEAKKYAGHAKAFERALEAGGWAVTQPEPKATPTQPTGGLLAFLLSLLGRKT